MAALQDKYQFNDNRIKALTVSKRKVPKGAEYIDFEFKEFSFFEGNE